MGTKTEVFTTTRGTPQEVKQVLSSCDWPSHFAQDLFDVCLTQTQRAFSEQNYEAPKRNVRITLDDFLSKNKKDCDNKFDGLGDDALILYADTLGLTEKDPKKIRDQLKYFCDCFREQQEAFCNQNPILKEVYQDYKKVQSNEMADAAFGTKYEPLAAVYKQQVADAVQWNAFLRTKMQKSTAGGTSRGLGSQQMTPFSG